MQAGVGSQKTMQEFFAGSGLVAEGLKGMFATVWANDISPQKAAVYRANRGDEAFLLGDIKNVRGCDVPAAQLAWASFPCQDLSLAGNMAGIHASRSGLVWEFLRVLDEMHVRPRVLLLENVMGLLTSKAGYNYKVVHEALLERGYRCGAVTLNADRFVPQSRPRVFIIAVARGVEIPAGLMGEGPTWLHNKAAAAIGAELGADWVWWSAPAPQTRQTTVADIVEQGVPFDKDAVLSLIPEAHRARLEVLDEAAVTGYRRTRSSGVQLELRFDGEAGCLRTPGGGSSKQFLVVRHAGQTHARLLTPREVARLMGAPDTFALPGSDNDAYKAMGDGVAVPVARFLGEQFLSKLVEVAYEQ